MCITLIAVSSVPGHPLVIAHNRDEYYNRPTAPANWINNGNVYGGRDLVHGGMWLGLSRRGKIALLTNYRDPSLAKENARSRGHLVRKFLEEEHLITNFKDFLAREANQYNPFNIIFGKWNELHYYCSIDSIYRQLSKGIYVLSNGIIDCNWFKVEKLRANFTKLINENSFTMTAVLALLSDQTLCPEDQLPSTGIPKSYELAISSVYVKTPQYGTRTSTVIAVNNEGFASMKELTYCQNSSPQISKLRLGFRE